MKVKGWNNGSPLETGAGYGIRISRKDREAYFRREWESVIIDLEGGSTIEVNISESFWRDCIELRSARIGKWMIRKELAPWEKNNPPSLELKHIEGRKFKLKNT
ncbi:hypothetical protein AKJ58_00320 [candidate division MSBL1 archaeon SCGC-AAA385D11]|uniref:Uncharacterized protein n=1 Tax=candidate division MSBL1 archaeon SCGC-AAA385D11 TaxID=1698286 RepID=A0A133VPB1_9EURY|nr:hypothetical protein AKJ58_00320 [candidate division MSBL1 archaeon SCGC-AAA385D11]